MPISLGIGVKVTQGGGLLGIAAIKALNPFAFYVVAPQYLFQEEDGTGAVSADGTAVGYVTDLSGNGNHLTQSTAGSRPLYKTSGGLNWLEFDGSDDGIAVTFASSLSQPTERISAFRRLDAPGANNDYLFIEPADIDGQLFITTDATAQLDMYSGAVLSAGNAPAVDADFIATERYNGGSSRIAIDTASYSTGNAGTNSIEGILIGGGGLTGVIKERFYGAVVFDRLLTDPEIALCRTFMASLQGRAL